MISIGRGRGAGRDADHDDAAAVPRHLEGRGHGLRAPQRLEGDVHALAAGQAPHLGDGVPGARVDAVRRAEPPRRVELLRPHVDRDDPGRAEAPAPAGSRSSPTPPVPTTATVSPARSAAWCLTAPYAVMMAQPEDAGVLERERLRQAEDVGGRNHAVLGQPAPCCTSRAACRRRGAAGSRRRRGRPCRRFRAKNVSQRSSRPRAQKRQRPHGMMKEATTGCRARSARRPARPPRPRRNLVTEHRRQGELDLALHDVEVGVADAAGPDPDKDLPAPGLRARGCPRSRAAPRPRAARQPSWTAPPPVALASPAGRRNRDAMRFRAGA